MAWWDHAKSGDPIVCIHGCESLPLLTFEGKTYVFEYVEKSPEGYGDAGEIGVKLRGLHAGYNVSGKELLFFAKRFRPAKTTDLPESLIKCLDAPVSRETEDAA